MEKLLLRQLGIVQSVGNVDQEEVRNLVSEHLIDWETLDRCLSVLCIQYVKQTARDSETVPGGQESWQLFFDRVSQTPELILVSLALDIV